MKHSPKRRPGMTDQEWNLEVLDSIEHRLIEIDLALRALEDEAPLESRWLYADIRESLEALQRWHEMRDKGRGRDEDYEKRDMKMAEEFLGRWSGKLGISKTALAADIGGSRNANGRARYYDFGATKEDRVPVPLKPRASVEAIKKGLSSLKKLNPRNKDWSDL